MNSDRNSQTLGLLNFFTLLIFGVITAWIAKDVSSEAGTVAVCFLGFGAMVSAVAYFQMRLEARERVEKLEYDELTRAKDASTLFDATELESFPARRSREQFERFFIPTFTFVLMSLQIAAVIYLWQWLDKADALSNPDTYMGVACFLAFSGAFYLFGEYSGARARLANERLLRPSAGYIKLSAILTFVMACSEILVKAGFPKLDVQIGRIVCVVIGLAALENLFTLIFEAYRPRVRGQAPRLIYESRVIGLLGQPTGLVSTAAQVMDYQFGFKVSETWFYKLLVENLPKLILIQLLLIWVCTCFVFIEPNEQALLERFGAPVGSLTPGVHLKLPWPVSKIYRFTTTQIQSFTIGIVPDEKMEQERTLVWTKQHNKEEDNMLVASRQQLSGSNTNDVVPVNLLSVSIPVQFTIADIKDWAYHHANASQLLQDLATREVVDYLVSVDMDEIMATGRLKAADDLKARIQKTADEHKLGVKIVFVGMQDVHPPVAVAEAFEAVNGAIQQKEATILAAEADRSLLIPRARADAKQKIVDAEVYQQLKKSKAAATAGRYEQQLTAYAASPTVFTYRSYLEALTRGIGPTRKTILGTTNTQDVIILDMQDKIRTDLLSTELPEVLKK